jgi:hypothetical protein
MSNTVASLTEVIQDFAQRARNSTDLNQQGEMPAEYDEICERIDALEATGVDVSSLHKLMEPVHAMFPRNMNGGRRTKKSKKNRKASKKSKKSKKNGNASKKSKKNRK